MSYRKMPKKKGQRIKSYSQAINLAINSGEISKKQKERKAKLKRARTARRKKLKQQQQEQQHQKEFKKEWDIMTDYYKTREKMLSNQEGYFFEIQDYNNINIDKVTPEITPDKIEDKIEPWEYSFDSVLEFLK